MPVDDTLPLILLADPTVLAEDTVGAANDASAPPDDQNAASTGVSWFDGAADQFSWDTPTEANDRAGDENLISLPHHVGSGAYIAPLDLDHAPALNGTLDAPSGTAGLPDAFVPASPTPSGVQTIALSTSGPVAPVWLTYGAGGSSPSVGSMHAPGRVFVLIDGDGEVVSGPAGGSRNDGGGGGSGSSGPSSPSGGGGASTSPFQINITYDSSVANAPAGFKTAIDAAVQYFESQFTDAVTINLNVGYGEVGGYSMGAGALGESLTYLTSFSYAQVRQALVGDATSADDATSVANLPASSPVSGTIWTSTAEARALGLLGSYSGVDGYVGFASGNLFDYDNSNGVTAGQYDFYGVFAHELTEVMGRALLVGGSIGSSPHGYYPLDFFHYSAPGTPDFVGTKAGYFSINGGATNLDNFNTNPYGDFGDWAASAGNDSFLAFSYSGVVNAITPADLTAVDVIGWDRALSGGSAPPPPPPPPPSPPPPSSAPDLTVSGLSFDNAHISLRFELHNIGTGAAAASTTGVFLSADSTITTSDHLVGTAHAPALAPGHYDTESATLTLPTSLAPNVYFIGAIANYDGGAAGPSNVSSSLIEIVLGNDAANKLAGTAGAHIIFGLGGNDTLSDGPGGDTMYGGSGNDAYAVNNSADLVIEKAGEGIDTVNASISYALPGNVENLALTGSAGLSGVGNNLNNVITGNAGSNTLAGGLGSDMLTGGKGADTFVFNTAPNSGNIDTIVDFKASDGDRIELDHAIFAALQSLGGTLLPSEFYASKTGTAHAATDFILYNTKTGALFYDPDGNGGASAVQIATLGHHPGLSAHDILIV
jgi:Ca2+-binding RTX toxin-like protein